MSTHGPEADWQLAFIASVFEERADVERAGSGLPVLRPLADVGLAIAEVGSDPKATLIIRCLTDGQVHRKAAC